MIDKFLLKLAAARGFLSKLWALSKPYWFSKDPAEVRLFGFAFTMREGLLGRLILALILAMNVFSVYLAKLFNDWNGRFYDALQHKDAAAFWREIEYFIVLAFVAIVVGVYSQWFQQLLTIRWRRWLTEVYFRDWLSNLTYYRMELVGDGTDNPEQRIEQDCSSFTAQTLDICIDLLSQVVTLVTFVSILWGLSGSIVVPILGGITVPGYMLWVAIVYSVVGTWLTYKIGRPLVRVNFNLQRYNADFRFRMIRVRENAEPIALYHGELEEQQSLSGSFGRIYAEWWQLMRYSKRLNWLTSFYGQAANVFPYVVAAPRYFSGAIELGTLMQIGNAFAQVQGSLSWFVDAYGRILAEWAAVVQRLTTFGEAMERAKELEAADRISVAPTAGNSVPVKGLDVRLPNGAPLIDGVSMEVGPGETISVGGPSGSGKSTLFRALSGLWPWGEGEVGMPEGERVLFLPQRSYLPIGTLKDALTYPEREAAIDDATCRDVLDACLLGHLVDSLNENTNWSLALSVGEQQRLAFARALLLKPSWIFIDEGTSALDAAMEAHLYTLLKERLPGTAIVSIAHRPEVVALHDRHLNIDPARHALVEDAPNAKVVPA